MENGKKINNGYLIEQFKLKYRNVFILDKNNFKMKLSSILMILFLKSRLEISLRLTKV